MKVFQAWRQDQNRQVDTGFGTSSCISCFNFDRPGKLSRVSSGTHCGGPDKGEGTQEPHGRMSKRDVAWASSAPHSTSVVECGLCGASPRSGAWAALRCKAPGDALLLGAPEPDRGLKVPEIRSVGCSQVRRLAGPRSLTEFSERPEAIRPGSWKKARNQPACLKSRSRTGTRKREMGPKDPGSLSEGDPRTPVRQGEGDPRTPWAVTDSFGGTPWRVGG